MSAVLYARQADCPHLSLILFLTTSSRPFIPLPPLTSPSWCSVNGCHTFTGKVRSSCASSKSGHPRLATRHGPITQGRAWEGLPATLLADMVGQKP